MLANPHLKLSFKQAELQYLNWLYNAGPCFPVNAHRINIITDPRHFYDTLCGRFKNAMRRITIASLYIGTGTLERRILDSTRANLKSDKNVKLHVLLDYQRGTRGEVNSRNLLQDVMRIVEDQCSIYLYQTPRLQNSWSKALPSRYNELIGLQHMKLYIVDNSVIISGANFSNDYFKQRQDRYIEIQDANLADFYCELIDEVSKISKKCEGDKIKEPNYTNMELMVRDFNHKISGLIDKWKEKQFDIAFESEANTWVFPIIQMGEFRINQDQYVTQSFLAGAPPYSTIKISTGYFNLTEDYSNVLLNSCNADISLLMAHPNANGFLGASGPAGGIPHAYSLLAKQFWQKVVQSGQENRIRMFEYERPGWTFHAKGLWFYPPGCKQPWATLVGSANLGERSVRRDLEAQAAIVTTSPELQEQLHEECEHLHKHATECSTEFEERRTPMWVRATVGLFRSYF